MVVDFEELTYGRMMHIFGYCSCPEIIQERQFELFKPSASTI